MLKMNVGKCPPITKKKKVMMEIQRYINTCQSNTPSWRQDVFLKTSVSAQRCTACTLTRPHPCAQLGGCVGGMHSEGLHRIEQSCALRYWSNSVSWIMTGGRMGYNCFSIVCIERVVRRSAWWTLRWSSCCNNVRKVFLWATLTANIFSSDSMRGQVVNSLHAGQEMENGMTLPSSSTDHQVG